MRVAFLGCDADVVMLARALSLDARFELTEAFVDGPWREQLAPLCEHTHASGDWPALLGPVSIDVLVVGRERGDAAGPDPLRRLTQLGMPVVLPHPVGGPLLALELDMIRRDSGAPLIPFYPGCRHPLLAELRAAVAAKNSASVGEVEQLVFERALSDRSREAVATQLAQDIGLIQAVLGPLNKVAAQGPPPESDSWNNLNVQLSGETTVLARWSVEPVADADRGRVTLIGSRGRLTVELPERAKPWRLRTNQSDNANESHDEDGFEQRAEAERAVEAIAAILANVSARGSGSSGQAEPTGPIAKAGPIESTGPAWPAVCRELELADAVEVSLRKRRTIELHHETVTEEDTFKGLMSAVGCLLVLLVPLVLIGAAIVEGLTAEPSTTVSGEPLATPEPHAFRRFWPLLIAIPLVFFLLLQTLKFVFPSPSRSERKSG